MKPKLFFTFLVFTLSLFFVTAQVLDVDNPSEGQIHTSVSFFTGNLTNLSQMADTTISGSQANGTLLAWETTNAGWIPIVSNPLQAIINIFNQNLNTTSNVIFANLTAFNISATGNFIGNGSLLTGIDSPWVDGGGVIYQKNLSAKVGIGTTSPIHKLTVAGSINFTTGSLYFPDGTSMTTASTGSASEAAGWSNTSTTTSTALDVNLTSGDINIADGSAYLYSGVTALKLALGTDSYYANTFVGVSAGNSTAQRQTAVGYYAGYQNSGTLQTALGYRAGYQNTGSTQTALGYYAGYQNTGTYQTAIGYYAGYLNTGDYQTALGLQAGQQNTGTSQTALGYLAGYQNNGTYQTAIGYQAGYQNSGTSQTALGYQAGRQNNGTRVIGVGYEATRNNNGDDVVAIGYQAGKSNTADDQFIVKQANINAVPLIQGNFSSGAVGIGTTSPGAKLQVNGSQYFTQDSQKIYFGAGHDSSITYNGSQTIFNNEVGSGEWVFNNGNVGIGTTNPAHLLTVAGSANITNSIIMTSSNGSSFTCSVNNTGGLNCI